MKRNNRNSIVVRKVTSVITAIAGFLASLPFWLVVMFGEHQPYISLMRVFFVMLAVVGMPLMLFGLTTLFTKNSKGFTTTSEMDLQRIRHAVETDKMGRT